MQKKKTFPCIVIENWQAETHDWSRFLIMSAFWEQSESSIYAWKRHTVVHKGAAVLPMTYFRSVSLNNLLMQLFMINNLLEANCGDWNLPAPSAFIDCWNVCYKSYIDTEFSESIVGLWNPPPIGRKRTNNYCLHPKSKSCKMVLRWNSGSEERHGFMPEYCKRHVAV